MTNPAEKSNAQGHFYYPGQQCLKATPSISTPSNLYKKASPDKPNSNGGALRSEVVSFGWNKQSTIMPRVLQQPPPRAVAPAPTRKLIAFTSSGYLHQPPIHSSFTTAADEEDEEEEARSLQQSKGPASAHSCASTSSGSDLSITDQLTNVSNPLAPLDTNKPSTSAGAAATPLLVNGKRGGASASSASSASTTMIGPQLPSKTPVMIGPQLPPNGMRPGMGIGGAAAPLAAMIFGPPPQPKEIPKSINRWAGAAAASAPLAAMILGPPPPSSQPQQQPKESPKPIGRWMGAGVMQLQPQQQQPKESPKPVARLTPIPTNNGSALKKRGRVLSERGERELQYPEMDGPSLSNGWKNCSFISPTRDSGIGLCNPKNDCFLNAVLQSVVHIPDLARWVVESHSNCRKMEMECFHCVLRQHILRAVRENIPFRAISILQCLHRIFPDHEPGRQEDAHEMLTLLLDALEPKTPKGNGAPSNINNTTKLISPMPCTPLDQIFGGSLRNIITCLRCHTRHTNYERIREINLGLTRRDRTTILELFDDFFDVERLPTFCCTKCKTNGPAQRNTSILRAPKVLIIQLKRFNHYGGKNKLPVEPNLMMHVDRFIYNGEATTYKLIGMIQHLGAGINFGHYISAYTGFNETSWYHFDDSSTSMLNLSQVRNINPYILFYSRTKGSEAIKRTYPSTSASNSNGNINRPSPGGDDRTPFAKKSFYGTSTF